jgi:WD40 repeat protein
MGVVRAITFSANGKLLASLGDDQTVRLWDAKTGAPLRCLGKEHLLNGPDTMLRYLPFLALADDGKRVSTLLCNGSVRVLDTDSGKELQCFLHGGAATPAASSPGGKLLAGPRGKMVQVWEAATGREVHTLAGHCTRAQFSPNGKTLAGSGTRGTIWLWDVGTGRLHRSLTGGHRGSIGAIAYSRDGKLLASGGAQGGIVLWDAPTGKPVRRLSGHTGAIAGVAFVPDGKTLVSVGIDGPICLWETGSGKLVRQIAREGQSVEEMALSPDGKTLALTTGDTMIHLWDLTRAQQVLPVCHESAVHHVAFSSGKSTLLSADGDGTFATWETGTGKLLRRSAPGGPGWSPIAASRDGRLIVVKTPAGILLWDAKQGKERCRLAGKPAAITTAALSADQRTLATGSEKGEICLWDTATGKQQRRITVGESPILALALSPDGATVASAAKESAIRLWDARTGRDLRRLPAPVYPYCSSLAFSPDGRMLAGSGYDLRVRLWETATGQLVHFFVGLRRHPAPLEFSADGRLLAAGNWMGVRLYDVRRKVDRGEALGYQGEVCSLTFSPDSKVLASGGSDSTILLWDVETAFPTGGYGPGFLSPESLAECWVELASREAARAHKAVCALALTADKAVPLLAKHLKRAEPIEAKHLTRLLEALASEDAVVNGPALRELEGLGHQVESALRRALVAAREVDYRLRLNVLLGRLDNRRLSSEELRTVRAVQVLEFAGTPAARRLLADLASGAPEALLTREARASLDRLTGRSGVK